MIFELVSLGGVPVWILLSLSVVSLGIFLERLFFYRRATIDVGDFLEGIRSALRRRNYAEAIHESSATGGPVGRVVRMAVTRHNHPRSHLRDMVQEAGQLEVPRIERRLGLLLAIAHIAPLLGILGTILGILKSFVEVANLTGLATPTDLSQGVFTALITTAVGLVVAIPAYLMHGYLSSRARRIIHDVERAGIEALHLVDEAGEDHDQTVVAINEGAFGGAPQRPDEGSATP